MKDLKSKKKALFFKECKNMKKKKRMQKKFSLFPNIRNMHFDQSSSVQPYPEKKKTSGKISNNHCFFKKSENIEGRKNPQKKKNSNFLSFAN